MRVPFEVRFAGASYSFGDPKRDPNLENFPYSMLGETRWKKRIAPCEEP